MTKIILILFSIVTLMTHGFASESETVKGAKKDVANFKNEMSVKLEGIEKQIADLKVKAKNKGSEAKAKSVEELEATRDALKAKLASVSESSKDGWQNIKKSMAESVDALNAKVQKALKE